MRYLELGLQNPDLSDTALAMKQLRISSVEKLVGGGTIASERYLWFLDIMMEACESLINYFPTRLWEDTIKSNLRLHLPAIRLKWPDERKFYSDNLALIVDEVISERRSANS